MIRTRTIETTQRARNEQAYALGYESLNGFHIRRVVWGRLLARAERREGEKIRRVVILVTGK